MKSPYFEIAKNCIQLFSSTLAIFLNSLLIFLIYTKSPKKMGNYRHLMCYFCAISMIFAVLDFVLRPAFFAAVVVPQSTESSFILFIDFSHWKEVQNPPEYQNLRISESQNSRLTESQNLRISKIFPVSERYFYLKIYFFISIISVSISIVVNNSFLIRISRTGRLKYFKGPFLIFWFSLPLISGLNWSFLCYYLFGMSPKSSDYLRPITLDIFNVSISNISYSAAVFWPKNQISWSDFNWKHGIGFVNCVLLMQISFGIILWMCAKSRLKIKELLKQGVSKYSKDLQIQLYKALVVQTLIPTIFIFIPFGILFICPFFLINCEFISEPVTIFYSIYPVLDPLPLLFYIDIYRNACREILFSKCKPNRVDVFSVGNEERDSTNHSI
ncbi:Protein CBG11679 [Caenorhabditis briggsae]|uniref:Protein CBG11679 n=1 Tax=Caenorhabditis briggsae TaxID=6238 RepID=A8XDS8_CAEBR|nr:Protein CBG11679 [Caenorhabditis briggsae]CAP30798.2 Protein CBG11679 [Caenorhabditis briggsae]